MKKILPVIFLLLLSCCLYAQSTRPSYPDILKKFYTNYQASDDYQDYTAFAKKKDGWYVKQVDRTKDDKVLKEQLFFSFAQNGYLNLEAYYSKAEQPDIDKQLRNTLYKDGSIGEWYAFERVPYYGYPGWFQDVINDFGNNRQLSDTMSDAVGRSYDNLALSYLWYQQGGVFTGSDSLHRQLGRLEYPSPQRIAKAKEALDNGIAHFEHLNKINPAYKTVVGNGSLKLFNEYMHGYNQMIMCGNDQLAKEYVEKAPLAQAHIAQAKNYLNSCEPNAILVSYGDNDTYQLWYVQEKYGFRKDVTVVNSSLLGLPVYIDMLKRKKLLVIGMSDAYLRDQGSDAATFDETKKTVAANKPVTLKNWLDVIYKKQYPVAAEGGFTFPAFVNSNVLFALPVSIKTPRQPVQKNIQIKLDKKYYYLNELAILDIINNNISSRPIYFTELGDNFLGDHMMEKGIVYKLVAEDMNLPAQKNIEARGVEKFVNETWVPLLSNDVDFVCFDCDNTFTGLYAAIFNYYLDKKDTVSFKKWVKKFDAAGPTFTSSRINQGKMLAYYHILARDYKKAVSIMEQYAQWLQGRYLHPSALEGYHSKEDYINELTGARDMLEVHGLGSPLLDKMLDE